MQGAKCRKCGKTRFAGAAHICDERSMGQWIRDRRDYWGQAAYSEFGGARGMAGRMAERLTQAIEEGGY